MGDVSRMVRLLAPTAPPSAKEKLLAQRDTDLLGPRIGMLDKTTSHADVLMLHIAELLRQDDGANTVVHKRTARAALGATRSVTRAIALE